MQDVNHQLFTDSILSEVSLGTKNIESSYVEDVLRKLDLYEFKDRHLCGRLVLGCPLQ